MYLNQEYVSLTRVLHKKVVLYATIKCLDCYIVRIYTITLLLDLINSLSVNVVYTYANTTI